MREGFSQEEPRGERGPADVLRDVAARADALLERYTHSPFGRLVVGLSFVLSLEACGGAVQIGPGKVKTQIPDLGRVTVTASPDMEAALAGGFGGSIGITFREGKEGAAPVSRPAGRTVEQKYGRPADLGAIVPQDVTDTFAELTKTSEE